MEPYSEDKQLWESLRDGDERALARIFKKYYSILYNYGLKLTTEEMVRDGIQEIFAYLWEKRTKLSYANSVKAYLLVSLRRHLTNSLTRQKKQTNAYKEYYQDQKWEFFTVEDLLIYEELESSRKKELQAVLDKIPDRMREALYLKMYNSLSYKEIAEIMKVKPQVARNYVSEAFERLRALISKNI